MKVFYSVFLVLGLFNLPNLMAQNRQWNSVKVIPIKSRKINHDVCAGEWFVKAKASSMSDLNRREIRRIKKSAFEKGCLVVMVDVYHKFSNDNDEIYLLGIEMKK